MTILFIEGFENYNANADLAGFWGVGGAGPEIFQQNGRDAAAGKSIRMKETIDLITHPIIPSVSGVCGFAHRFGFLPGVVDTFIRFLNAAASAGLQLTLTISLTGQIILKRGVTTIATSNKTLAADIWYYIECKWFINAATGTCEVFVNGKKGGWIDFGPGNTLNAGGTADVDAIQFKGGSTFSGEPYDYDDVYILDLLGGAPGNDRLGDSTVETLNPSGAGAEAQWTPSAGSNFQNVDEATPDGDTTFNSSSVVDDDDRFAMDDLVNVPSTVFAAQVNGMFRLENAGTRTLKLKVEDTVTEGVGADFQATFDANYLGEFAVFEDHPTGAAPWSTAEINGMEAGYRIEA